MLTMMPFFVFMAGARRMMFMIVFIMMMCMPFRGQHCVRLFLCDQGTDCFFHLFPLVMIAVIDKRILQKVQRYIGNPFQLCDLSFQFCGAVCAVDVFNLKFIRGCICHVRHLHHMNSCSYVPKS